jgi:tRNA(Ile)-lysidine synthase
MSDTVNAMAKEVDAAIARMLESLPAHAKICVAYSGGEDSTVLLHALAHTKARSRGEISLTAHHVHHGLSTNADAWAAHCTNVCAQLNVPLMISRVTVERSSKQGIEAAAREMRYRALHQWADAQKHVIALAHHQRDQAETVLLQLLRGAGPEGLSAMPAHGDNTLRPLLGTSKSAIAHYAQSHALKYIEDDTNADRRFARNRLRNEVWQPLIDAFAGAEHTLARAALLQTEAATLMHELAAIDAATCIGNSALDLTQWRRLSSARRRNVLRHWLNTLSVRALSFATLSEWEKQLASDHAEQNIKLRVPPSETDPHTYVRVYRGRAYRVTELLAAPDPVLWQGESELRFGDGRIEFSSAADARANGAHKTAAIRLPKSGERWTVRTRREGDAIALSPNSGHVTLKNIMQNANVAPWDRSRWPILVCDRKIAALPGLCIAAEFAASTDDSGVFPEWSDGIVTANTH